MACRMITKAAALRDSVPRIMALISAARVGLTRSETPRDEHKDMSPPFSAGRLCFEAVNAYPSQENQPSGRRPNFILLPVPQGVGGANPNPGANCATRSNRCRLFSLRVGPKADIDSQKSVSSDIATTSKKVQKLSDGSTSMTLVAPAHQRC
jgi:hypothetical protein